MNVTMTPLANKEATMTENERQEQEMSAWVTVKQAAAMLEVSEQWTRELADRGLIEAMKPGRDWIISRASVEAYKATRDRPQK